MRLKTIISLLLSGYLFLTIYLASAQENERRDIGFQALEPFQIFDNLYFVGIKAVASYVIETSDGLILIDTLDGFEGFTDRLLSNIRELSLIHI